MGYYNDPVKTAEVFITVDGTRYVMPGDFATVEADGSVTLLGRGSICINSGGEKIFPEEVESVVRSHPDVMDAVVIGVPTSASANAWRPSSSHARVIRLRRSNRSRSTAPRTSRGTRSHVSCTRSRRSSAPRAGSPTTPGPTRSWARRLLPGELRSCRPRSVRHVSCRVPMLGLPGLLMPFELTELVTDRKAAVVTMEIERGVVRGPVELSRSRRSRSRRAGGGEHHHAW